MVRLELTRLLRERQILNLVRIPISPHLHIVPVGGFEPPETNILSIGCLPIASHRHKIVPLTGFEPARLFRINGF